MSAWICSEEHFARLANGIKRDSNFVYFFRKVENTEEALLKFINKLIKANHYAVNYRYNEKNRGYRMTAGDLAKYESKVDSKAQLLKLISCLSYQCSEGDTDIKFKKPLALLKEIESSIAIDIATSTPEYEAATWGTD
jgi:hypothetical protein